MTEIRFKGKEFVYNYHLAVPFCPLVPDKTRGVGPVDFNGNLIIEGDNLRALKALIPYYAGKVDCIYIDPPYNTGNEGWCYNDNVNSPMIKAWMSENPVTIDDGLRHDKWCTMMWPRLRLLCELLRDDGLVFVSIDDIENSKLVEMMREIFGEERYIGQFIWKSRQNKDNRNISGFSNDHEYIVVFGKCLKGELRLESNFNNADDDHRGAWSSGNLVGLASKSERPNLHYDLINPETGVNYGCPDRGWRYGRESMTKLIDDNRIVWPNKVTGRPREKVFMSELDSHTNVSSVLDIPIYTKDGTESLKSIFSDRVLPFPKPPAVVQYLIRQHPDPDAIVLDSFAGSGTTAQAVMEANSMDGGNRKFILVEMEDYADSITAERARRIIGGYQYSGRTEVELYRKNITWSTVEKSERLLKEISQIEFLQGGKYDKIVKRVCSGDVVVSGVNEVSDWMTGLGGTFTYCTLGNDIDLDEVLSGKDLPSYESIGAVLFHMATFTAFNAEEAVPEEYYLGKHQDTHIWLIYKPDINWLRSDESALTLTLAKKLAETAPNMRHLVFAPSKYVSREYLGEQNIPVEYVSLPYALYRIERG